MPVPKRKTSKSRRDKRSSGKGLAVKSVAACQTCSSPVAPHQVCRECGRYKGIKVIRTKTDRMHERGQVRKELEEKRQASQPAADSVVEQEAETKE